MFVCFFLFAFIGIEINVFIYCVEKISKSIMFIFRTISGCFKMLCCNMYY